MPWVKTWRPAMSGASAWTVYIFYYLPYISILPHTHITQCVFFQITSWFFNSGCTTPASGRRIVDSAPCASHGPRGRKGFLHAINLGRYKEGWMCDTYVIIIIYIYIIYVSMFLFAEGQLICFLKHERNKGTERSSVIQRCTAGLPKSMCPRQQHHGMLQYLASMCQR